MAAAFSAHFAAGETTSFDGAGGRDLDPRALGTTAGSIAGPTLFGVLIQMGLWEEVMLGCLLGDGLMIEAAVIEAFLGVDAEKYSLKEVVPPFPAA